MKYTEKRKPMKNGRWGIWLYLDREINWDKLVRENKDIEYSPDVGIVCPILRTSAGTICYRKKTIVLMHPHVADIEMLKDFALSRLDGRRTSKAWFEFVRFWKKDVTQ